MKRTMLCMAILCLAASGCARLACRDCGQGGHVARSQHAPRPVVSRTLYTDASNGLTGKHEACGLLGGCLPGKCQEDTQFCTSGEDCYGGTDAGCHDGSCVGGSGECGPRGGGLCGGAGCRDCGQGKGNCLCPHSGGYPERPIFNPGPPVGQVAYPYYTVRGPRDFLQDNPPSIGPY